MKFARLTIRSGTLLLAMLCGQAVAGGEAPEIYDMNSWKQLISDDCRAFFDGCNNCVRNAGSPLVACTRKACAVYQAPRCLDGEAAAGGSALALKRQAAD